MYLLSMRKGIQFAGIIAFGICIFCLPFEMLCYGISNNNSLSTICKVFSQLDFVCYIAIDENEKHLCLQVAALRCIEIIKF